MERIGIVGFGNMGSAIAEQIKSDYQVYCFDKDTAKVALLSGLRVVSDIEELVNESDALVLAVKPQDFDGLLRQIKPFIKDKLIISIAAGITTGKIEEILGTARVVRVMPNMPARIGEGVSCLCKGKFATEQDFDFAQELFAYLGETVRIDEGLMNAATAISGSGPGFCFDLIESNKLDAKNIDSIKAFVKDKFVPDLKRAAKNLGFSEQDAAFVSAGTGNGCIALLVKAKLSPSELTKQIASKGGTTEAGLEVLHRGGSLEEAVKAALKRAEELSKSLPAGRQGGN